MDLIYTDANRIEQGVLKNYDVDFDTTGKKDFQISVGIKNNVLKGGFLWYVEGTEYGGKVDKEKIITESSEIHYTGRNARGLLYSKVIEPPMGSDYLVLSGTLQEVITELISNAGYDDLFVVDASTINVPSYQFDRYIKLYDGIVKLLAAYGKIPTFTFKDGKIHIGVYEPVDYTDVNEFTQDDVQFTITKSYFNVNHLICLGQGELKDRTVIHLYTDKEGNISTNQTFFGEDEVVDIYENTNAASYDELLKEGTERLNELKDADSFEVTVPDVELKIGDIIGGLETNTNTYVAREIVNVIAKINESNIDLEYKVGEDDAARKSSSSGGSSSASSGSGVYNLPPATEETLGGVIIGDNINVDDDGRISVIVTQGEDGKSAYQIALDNGFEGTEEEWLASLKGAELGFTPVQQGGGAGQGTNKVYIGWASDGSGLKAQVDLTDLGYLALRSDISIKADVTITPVKIADAIQLSAYSFGKLVFVTGCFLIPDNTPSGSVLFYLNKVPIHDVAVPINFPFTQASLVGKIKANTTTLYLENCDNATHIDNASWGYVNFVYVTNE